MFCYSPLQNSGTWKLGKQAYIFIIINCCIKVIFLYWEIQETIQYSGFIFCRQTYMSFLSVLCHSAVGCLRLYSASEKLSTGGMILRVNWRTWRKICPRATLCSTNPNGGLNPASMVKWWWLPVSHILRSAVSEQQV